MKTLAKTLVAVALVSGLAACAQPETPEDRYYRLQTTSQAPAQSPLLSGILQVDRFQVDGLVGRSQIVYVADGKAHELKTYHYHHWTEPPAVLLQDQLIDYLRRAKAANQVVSPEMRVSADYVLTGKVKRLEQITGASPKAVVELEVGVRSTRGGKLVLLVSERAEAPADSAAVGDGVAAMNTAVSIVFRRILDGLKTAK